MAEIHVGKFINNLDTEDLTSEKLQGVVNNVYAKAIKDHKKTAKKADDNLKQADEDTVEFEKSNHDRLKANKDKVAKDLNKDDAKEVKPEGKVAKGVEETKGSAVVEGVESELAKLEQKKHALANKLDAMVAKNPNAEHTRRFKQIESEMESLAFEIEELKGKSVVESKQVNETLDDPNKTEFHYAFQVSRMIIFEVDYYTLGSNKEPYFATSAAEFNRPKSDYNSSGQAQESLLKGFPTAYNFYKKWDPYHLKDLTDEQYEELVKDIERLKQKYNYVEQKKDTFAGSDSGISFYQARNLSMQPLKRSTVTTESKQVKEDYYDDYWAEKTTDYLIKLVKEIARKGNLAEYKLTPSDFYEIWDDVKELKRNRSFDTINQNVADFFNENSNAICYPKGVGWHFEANNKYESKNTRKSVKKVNEAEELNAKKPFRKKVKEDFERKLEPGDKIICKGNEVTIGGIFDQFFDKKFIDIEFVDDKGRYRTWKSDIDGGKVVYKESKKVNEASYRGLAYYEYKGCHVRETPSYFVATNEHGTTIGQSLTRYGAEGIIDDYVNGKRNNPVVQATGAPAMQQTGEFLKAGIVEDKKLTEAVHDGDHFEVFGLDFSLTWLDHTKGEPDEYAIVCDSIPNDYDGEPTYIGETVGPDATEKEIRELCRDWVYNEPEETFDDFEIVDEMNIGWYFADKETVKALQDKYGDKMEWYPHGPWWILDSSADRKRPVDNDPLPWGPDESLIKEAEEKIEPGNIHAILVKELPAEDIDHHDSDLYVRKTPKSTEIINRLTTKSLLSTFKDQIDGDIWYELPFCFSPDLKKEGLNEETFRELGLEQDDKVVYEFPELTKEDIRVARRFGLKDVTDAWGTDIEGFEEDTFLQGTLKDIKNFAREIEYILVDGFLFDTEGNQIDLDDEGNLVDGQDEFIDLRAQWEDLSDKIKIIEFDNGDYYYVDVDWDEGVIFAGTATNTGVIREYELDLDPDYTIDELIAELYDAIIEDRPELIGESKKLKEESKKPSQEEDIRILLKSGWILKISKRNYTPTEFKLVGNDVYYNNKEISFGWNKHPTLDLDGLIEHAIRLQNEGFFLNFDKKEDKKWYTPKEAFKESKKLTERLEPKDLDKIFTVGKEFVLTRPLELKHYIGDDYFDLGSEDFDDEDNLIIRPEKLEELKNKFIQELKEDERFDQGVIDNYVVVDEELGDIRLELPKGTKLVVKENDLKGDIFNGNPWFTRVKFTTPNGDFETFYNDPGLFEFITKNSK